MPELPEVETVARDLRPVLVGRTLRAVRRTSAVELRRPWDAAWEALVAGRQVAAVRRRGKWIVLDLDDGTALCVHLGMTGQFTVVPAEREPATHTHLVFELSGPDEHLRFRDTRRFGSVTWHDSAASLEAFFVDNGLGPEPFDLDPKAWRQALAGTTRAIKAVLLDQTVVAGVGNIYADESLFRAKLHPTRRANDLTRPEADRLRKAVAAVLTHAIEKRGSTIRDYIGGSGLSGGFQDEFSVYGRTGEPCRGCGEAVAVLRLAGRSTHHCPRCQPPPPPSSVAPLSQDEGGKADGD